MTLRWTRLAVSHLDSAFESLAQDNPDAAGAVADRILSAVEALERHPEMGRSGRVPRTRELVVTGTPFIAAYRVRKDRVEILAVLHGARRWPARFE
ncbi:MAG: type II toxin-antitoxin system RelE/ParE family toxin [Vicinamibacterales bacterium]|nr:type II toxin-antitoxin system RelE/ParE family toxin [Vicinamibacterales bacterium]